MFYSIEEALLDASILIQADDEAAALRLDAFVSGLSFEDIQEHYLALAHLYRKMPFLEAVRLAHVVIERFLWQTDSWADVLLWSFDTLRQVPLEDTVWITRNYYAASLKAIGETTSAEEVLTENWISGQSGSSTAYSWLTGTDVSKSAVQRALDAASGKGAENNEFLELRASWLNKEKVENVRKSISSYLTDSMGRRAFELAESQEGLVHFLLQMAAEIEPAERSNGLLGMYYASLQVLKLDDADFLHAEATNLKLRGDGITIAIGHLSIAALLMHQKSYIDLITTLRELGLFEQAEGYANVAVWKNIPGSADELISLLGLDGVQINSPENVDEAMKVQLYKMANGQF